MSDKLCQGKIIHRKAGAARAAMRRALVEGRHFIGIEKDAAFFDIARARISAVDARPEQRSLL